MRKLILFTGLIFFAACGSSEKSYEKKIAEVVQTEPNGTRHDWKFKALETDILERITVADSIRIITQNFEKEKNKEIDRLEKNIALNQEIIGERTNLSIIQQHEDNITKATAILDEVRATQPESIDRYRDRNNSDELAVVVRCRYSILNPLNENIRMEETYDFYLSPDGSVCYDHKKESNN